MSTIIPAGVAQRLNYQNGMFLTSKNMTLEQDYFSNWLRLQNQFLYTPGVVNGLLVTQQGAALAVSQGVAIDADGNFLILPGDATPLTVAPTASNPMLVYALYPDNTGATTPVVDQAAQLATGASLPPNAIALASVALDAHKGIVSVTDTRVAVTSRLPAVLDSSPAAQHMLHGTLALPQSSLDDPGACSTVTVHYLPSRANAFSAPPTVLVTVNGSIPYATAVQAGTAHVVVTLKALAPPHDGSAAPTLSWLAMANPTLQRQA